MAARVVLRACALLPFLVAAFAPRGPLAVPPRRGVGLGAAQLAEELGTANQMDVRDARDPIERSVLRFKRDLEVVDAEQDQVGALRESESNILIGAVLMATVACLMPVTGALAGIARGAIVVSTAVATGVGSYEEYQGASSFANAHEIAAIATRAAAEGEELLSGAERSKCLLPVCVVVGATATALSLLTPLVVEVVPGLDEDGEADVASYVSPTVRRVLKLDLPELDRNAAVPATNRFAAVANAAEVPKEEPVASKERAAALKTLLFLICPLLSLTSASVAVLAQNDTSRRCFNAQSLGRRRFATKKDIGRTWQSVTEQVATGAAADTGQWISFIWGFLPAPLLAALVAGGAVDGDGFDSAAYASLIATATAATQSAYHLAVAEFNLARAVESVSAKSRTAAVAEAYSDQAKKANAQVPYANSIACFCTGIAAVLVEVAPRPYALPLPFAAAAAVRGAAKYRSRARGDASAVAAAADQLAGLNDGSDDAPLLPLLLTWRNFRKTIVATKNLFVKEARLAFLKIKRTFSAESPRPAL